MPEMPEIKVKVKSQKGNCHAGHKVGDEFVIRLCTPEGLCTSAFCTLFPVIEMLRFGGSYPWMEDPGKAEVACPDPENPVVFELKRVL